jgi:alkaline phosphatase D
MRVLSHTAGAHLSRRAWLQRSAVAVSASTLAPGLLSQPRAPASVQAPLFALGVASGYPSPHGVVLWTRLTGRDLLEAHDDDSLPDRVSVRWQVAEDERFERIVAQGLESAEEDWAHSVHAEPQGLAPGREYVYRFEALGQQSPIGRTRTAPAADAAASLRFATASCQRFEAGHFAAWRHLARERLDLVLFLGDYLYEYAAGPRAVRGHGIKAVKTLGDYRARHALMKTDAHLQAAHAACPWVLLWDDHEVQNDYAGLQGADLDPWFPMRRAYAYQAYWEHMPLPKASRPLGQGLAMFHRLHWGRLATLHALDTRQHRDPQACPAPGRGGARTLPASRCPDLADPSRSMLGAEQEAWLAQGWDLQRPWNLVAQQTLMAQAISPAGAWSRRSGNTNDGTTAEPVVWTDGWDGYAPARTRLLQGAADRQAPGLVVFGGDVHAHCVADLRADFNDASSRVIGSEFTVSSITSPGGAQASWEQVRALAPHLKHVRSDQRGAMLFDLTAARLEASLLAVDDVRQADSAVQVAARFVIDPRQPGVTPA